MRDKFRQVSEIYREDGLAQTARSIHGYTTNNVERLYPRSIAGKLFNSTRSSTSIWDFDWDICCILDGCRYDTFERVYQGDSTRIRSVGSTSQTWIPRTFENTDTSDVAYVTANPFSQRVDAEEFAYYHLEPVIETEYEIETVPPDVLAERTIALWRDRDRWDINQIVVHFMQPHAPFRNLPDVFDQFGEQWGSDVWKQLGSDEIDRSEFFEAYRDNLAWVLEEGVGPILSNCNARIAMTADHGNAAGEWGYHGHPRNAPVSSVRTVPWAIEQGTDQGTVSPEIEHSHDDVDVEDQLKALGYR